MPNIERIYSEISTRLVVQRRIKDVRQEALALKIGLSQSWINQLETNKKHPSIKTLYLIADALECSIYDLLPNNKQSKE